MSDLLILGTLEKIAGINGSRARLVRFESIGAIVSDFDGERALVTRENALAHDGVVRQVLASQTPLPFRFGMVVSASRLESYIRARRAALLSQLARVRDSVEMSVKVIWDAEAVKRAANKKIDEDIKNDSAQGPGADFLRAKQREITGGNALKAQAERLANWLGESLGTSVRESVVRTLPSEAMALTAAYLVERARIDEYRERVRQASAERADLRFLTSGEWPPYSFCNLDS